MTSIASLNFINKLVFHGVSWFICARSWNEFRYFCINKAWESIVFFIRLYCFWSKLTRLNFLMILSWTKMNCLWSFAYKSFSWDSKWWFLTMRIKFLCCNCISCMNLISTWTWSCIFNVLNWVIIRITVTDICWWWCFLRIYSTFCWIFGNSRLSYFLLDFIFVWYVTFSLIHCSNCFTGKSWWRFKSI